MPVKQIKTENCNPMTKIEWTWIGACYPWWRWKHAGLPNLRTVIIWIKDNTN